MTDAEIKRFNDSLRQRRQLQSSLEIMIRLAFNASEAQPHLERPTILHDRSHQHIRPTRCTPLLNRLVGAVRESDSRSTPEAGDIRRSAMAGHQSPHQPLPVCALRSPAPVRPAASPAGGHR